MEGREKGNKLITYKVSTKINVHVKQKETPQGMNEM